MLLYERELRCLSGGTSDCGDADGVVEDAPFMVARADGGETTARQAFVAWGTLTRLPGPESRAGVYSISIPATVLGAGQSSTGWSERNQGGVMMPSSAVQTTRPETTVAVGPPRNVSPPNGEFLLFDCV